MITRTTGNGTVSSPRAWADYRASIDAVTAYIHQNIDGDLQLENLAGIAGFSSFHFHRIFAAMTGERVAEYVRRVRLASAVHHLMHSGKPVSEIAILVGYETPAAFTKAFRQRFGAPPSRLRALDRTSAFALLLRQPPPNPVKRREIRPEIRTLPEQQVYYVRRYGMIDYQFGAAADDAFCALWRHLYQESAADRVEAALGITPDDYNVVPHDRCRFDAGVVLKRGVSIEPSGEVGVQVLEGGRWAVFRHEGPYNTLWQTWNTVLRDWLPFSGEFPRDVPPVEVYLNNVHTTPPADLRTEILIPIASP
jgi:AraC family transcriptional regulator